LDALGRGLGVDLSFAISGFLITTLLVREFTRTGKIDVRRFYARRTLRIFPLYFAVLGLYVVLVIGTRSGTPQGAAFMHHLPAFATYTTNWFVPLGQSHPVTFNFAWSLATQEQFYLLWPLALVLCLAPGRWWRAGAVLFAVIAVNEIARHAVSGPGVPTMVVRSAAVPICLGAIWALMLHSRKGFSVVRRALGHRAAALCLFAVLAATIAMWAPYGILEFLLAALVAACSIREDNLAAPLLTARPVRFVGKISYGMYLLHMLAISSVRAILGARFGLSVFVGGTAVAIAMAYASYRWFETPILRYRDRIARSRVATPPPGTLAGSVPAASPHVRA
jgi:peptidoglycan/LPS O-acetylase OafA/YrhL